MLPALTQVALYLLLPALILFGAKRFSWMRVVSPVVLCYAVGIVMGNLPFFPIDQAAATQVVEIMVGLSIPMLLFSTQVVRWFRYTGKVVLSFMCCIVAVMISSTAGAWLMQDQLVEHAKMAGMAVGVYTGGTPNMAAIQVALSVPQEIFGAMNAADLVVSGVYLLFLMGVAQKILLRFYPAFQTKGRGEIEQTESEQEEIRPLNVLLSLGFGLLALGVSFGLTELIFPFIGLGNKITFLILCLTLGGIGGSFIPKIRTLKGSYETGEYLLLIFCVALGAQVNFQSLLASIGPTFQFMLIVIVGALFIHYLLAYFFRIDVDTLLITSTAGIFGPPFIGPVAKALNNRELIGPGITTGLIGFAVGNFLGILMANLLASL